MGIEVNLYCSRHGRVTEKDKYIDANGTLRCKFCNLRYESPLPLENLDARLAEFDRRPEEPIVSEPESETPEPELNKPISETAKRAAQMLKIVNDSPSLDPYDPFDKVILKMIEVNRAKRRDYALDGEFDSNFSDVAFNLGIDDFGNVESAYALLLTKVARIRSLRKNGRMADPSNESVVDTFVDLANYAVLCLAMIQEKQNGSDKA